MISYAPYGIYDLLVWAQMQNDWVVKKYEWLCRLQRNTIEASPNFLFDISVEKCKILLYDLKLLFALISIYLMLLSVRSHILHHYNNGGANRLHYAIMMKIFYHHFCFFQFRCHHCIAVCIRQVRKYVILNECR